MSQKKFHHGNLRAELLELASRRIEETGHEALSMRELASLLAVSSAAPYRHFPNKEALLQEIALGAVEELQRAYRIARDWDGTAMERFRIACRAYLDLAARRPQAFRLMFMSENYLRTGGPEGRLASYELFVDLAADAFGAQGRADAQIAALSAWSTLHGFAIIRMDSRVPEDMHSPAAISAILDKACTPAQR